jgi:glycosyltransferase involved in cell wall biosynthesis
MAAGLPIVAADFTSSRAVVEETRCGILVRPGDVPGFVDAILKLIADPEGAAEMGRKGLEAFRSRYNWEAEMTALQALYRRLLPYAFAAE